MRNGRPSGAFLWIGRAAQRDLENKVRAIQIGDIHREQQEGETINGNFHIVAELGQRQIGKTETAKLAQIDQIDAVLKVANSVLTHPGHRYKHIRARIPEQVVQTSPKSRSITDI